MNYEPIGQARYAKFDHSDSVNRIAHHVHVPGWFGAYIYALKHGDNKAAELIRALNSFEAGYQEGYGDGQHSAIDITNRILEAMSL